MELREYTTKNIEFKSTWVLEELKVEEVKLGTGAKYFIDFLDENGIIKFSLGSETKKIRNEFKSDTLMKESKKKEIQKAVLKSLFVDTFKARAGLQGPAEVRINSFLDQKFVSLVFI